MLDDVQALSWIYTKLGVDPATMELALDERHHYRRVFIPKRGPKDQAKGRKRVLHVPPGTRKNPGPLRVVQRRIHKWLLKGVSWPTEMHGFIRKRSPLTAAARHAVPMTRAFLEIDFKNAFDSVTCSQVYRSLLDRLRLDPRVSYWIAELVTHKPPGPKRLQKRLPQGPASSPLIFNLVCWDLDEELRRYAKEHGYTYNRYADAILISSRRTLSAEESRNGMRVIPWEHRREIVECCRKFGFRVPPEKVRYQERRWRTPTTMGVLMREWGLGLSNRKVVDNIRAMVHRAISNPEIPPEKIKGKLAWVQTVDPRKLDTRLAKSIRQLKRLRILSGV